MDAKEGPSRHSSDDRNVSLMASNNLIAAGNVLRGGRMITCSYLCIYL